MNKKRNVSLTLHDFFSNNGGRSNKKAKRDKNSRQEREPAYSLPQEIIVLDSDSDDHHERPSIEVVASQDIDNMREKAPPSAYTKPSQSVVQDECNNLISASLNEKHVSSTCEWTSFGDVAVGAFGTPSSLLCPQKPPPPAIPKFIDDISVLTTTTTSPEQPRSFHGGGIEENFIDPNEEWETGDDELSFLGDSRTETEEEYIDIDLSLDDGFLFPGTSADSEVHPGREQTTEGVISDVSPNVSEFNF